MKALQVEMDTIKKSQAATEKENELLKTKLAESEKYIQSLKEDMGQVQKATWENSLRRRQQNRHRSTESHLRDIVGMRSRFDLGASNASSSLRRKLQLSQGTEKATSGLIRCINKGLRLNSYRVRVLESVLRRLGLKLVQWSCRNFNRFYDTRHPPKPREIVVCKMNNFIGFNRNAHSTTRAFIQKQSK